MKWLVDLRRSFNQRRRRSREENLRTLAERGETLDSFTIRDATEADIPALAHLHVVERFLAMGLTSMWLIGEADNPSTAFHEAMGGYNQPNADGTMNYGNFFWDDLRALARKLDDTTKADPSLRSG